MRRALVTPLLLTFLAATAHSDAVNSLNVTPSKLDFGLQTVNFASQPAAITIFNQSSSDVTFDEVISSGIDFQSKNECGKQLPAGARCTIQVVFKPVISGDRRGVVEILASDSAVPRFVALGGTGQ